jgi:signal transduction histidine kinase
MLSLAQINEQKFRKNLSIFDIQKSIEEVMLITKHRAEYSGLKTKLIFKGFENKQMVCTDEGRLQQVLLNFYSNALKFTSRGGEIRVICRLTFDQEKQEESIEFSVRDTGVGISQED